jgi:hypothetical protein
MRLPTFGKSRTATSNSAASNPTTDVTAPRATRIRISRRADMRLWLGLVLVVASMFVGAHLMSRDAPTVSVWQASRDLSAGAPALHVRPVTVALGSVSQDYLTIDEQPSGQLRFPIAEGELIPRSALVDPSVEPVRIVTIGVDPLHAPVELVAGDRVDIWSTPGDGSAVGPVGDPMSPISPISPTLVLADVLVESVSTDTMGSRLAVVVRVSPQEVPTVVQASRAGVIDLVSVPASSQGLFS